MASNELATLKERVLAVDFSVSNPRVQSIIESKVVDWVNSYDLKNARKLGGDCYGSRGDIPDSLTVAGRTVTPHELLSHVQARDEYGMTVLQTLFDYRMNDPIMGDPRTAMANSLSEKHDLDEISMPCFCGKHSQSFRDLAEGIIRLDPDNIFLMVGWRDAIINLYAPQENARRNKFILP